MIEGNTKDMLHAITAFRKKGMITIPSLGNATGLQAALGGTPATWPLVILRKDRFFVMLDITVDSAEIHGAANRLTAQTAHQNGLRVFKDAISKTDDYAILDRNLYDYASYCKKYNLEMLYLN